MLDAIAEPFAIIANQPSASRLTLQNWRSNLVALNSSQADIAELAGEILENVEWVFARDGALTAILNTGKWWAGCSLPLRAAKFMLGKTDLSATVICFLYPSHAAQLQTVLERMQCNQAIIAIVPDVETLKMILACDDFASAITSHQLFFAAGENWETQLAQLLENETGLPTPTQFIRPILSDSSPADALIAPAQKIFVHCSNQRAENVRELRERWTNSGLRRICVVAPHIFRLWDNVGSALLQASTGTNAPAKAGPTNIELRVFNPDIPNSASPVALTAIATACDAVVMPGSGRGDLPDVLPADMPMVSWITTPRIPSSEKAGPRDALLVADPKWVEDAVARGWKRSRVFVAGWPAAEIPPLPTSNRLAIISDTRPLDPPEQIIEYSSHRLLWEKIAHELLNDPFALNGAADEYLTSRMRQSRVEEQGFDRMSFLTGVVWNAYQQGIAKLLISENLSVDLFGNGWDLLPEFASCSGGPVRSRQQLSAMVGAAPALVHAWPTLHVHPMEAMGMPMVRFANSRDAFIRDARLALEGKLAARKPSVEPLSPATIFRALST